ncbi:hypothetical protein GWK48_09655 [Metallosphaera tengchongensis]|uniref:Uncharacterized protein n=1 Tax=Metallosphaera tengchongensis TaxID=1532350 RepID=A0A6N0NYG2_9CREN|nr:hypothetical protein [Metallosphaera tengchongensis]QKR00609.1 hypothetical protein GWK48_09655 [Metallosphaera tengchongensis]
MGKFSIVIVSLLFWFLDYPISVGILRGVYGVDSTPQLLLFGVIDYLVEAIATLIMYGVARTVKLHLLRRVNVDAKFQGLTRNKERQIG